MKTFKDILNDMDCHPFADTSHLICTEVTINSPTSQNHGRRAVVHSIERGGGYCCVRVLDTNAYLTFNANNLLVNEVTKRSSVNDESFTVATRSHTEIREVTVRELRMKFDNDMAQAVLKDINGDGPKTEYEDELVDLFYEKLDKALRS